MTSPIPMKSAEERAGDLQAELVELSRLNPRQVSWIWDDQCAALIASALRQVEREAYELAAGVAASHSPGTLTVYTPRSPWTPANATIADAIRALIEQEPA